MTRCMTYVASETILECARHSLLGNLTERDSLKDTGVDGTVVLQLILMKESCRFSRYAYPCIK